MAETQHKQSIGLVMTTAIVVGTIIGSGIFLLPASLAPLGINAAIGWVVSGVGALCVAYALSRIVRPDGAGLQSYVEAELGSTAGFLVTFALWVSSWAAMAATSIAAAAALSRVVPGISDPRSVAMVAIAATAAVTAVNLRGVRAAGGFALVTVAIRILPLLAVIAVVALREFKQQPIAPLAPTPVTADNIATAVTLTLFAIIGFETGTAPVGKVRNPTRTIPLALMTGTAFCVLIYLFSSTSVSLILSPEATANSLAPYADALKANWGEGAARLAAMGIAIAAIGGLNSNLLCAGEVGFSLGLRGDLPSQLARSSPSNTPITSLLLACILTVLLVLVNTSKSTAELFIFVGLLTTTATLVVYVFGAVAALRTRPSRLAVLAIAASILFSLFAFYGAGLQANLWGLALLVAGLAIRWLCHRLMRSQGGSSRAVAGSSAAPPESSA
jgi:APA family basic amino acid/polyamine antiporter